MELKLLKERFRNASPYCSNRTFMELKLRGNVIWLRKGSSSNRTFMELKLDRLEDVKQKKHVLIAPLWNWNSVPQNYLEALKSRSNRTFMELKLPYIHSCFHPWKVLIAPLWNWNMLIHYTAARFDCSNRTFMELKCDIHSFRAGDAQF
mgnify:CR=1 FL=1